MTPLRASKSKRRAAVLAVGLTTLIAPAVASADSVVYIDGGNVWSAHPDGTGKVQLTDGGDWHSPTQSDDGTIAAVKGTGPIQVMTRDGRPLHSISTAEQRASDGSTVAARPVSLAFSPDASKIAYAYAQASCPVASTCGGIATAVFYTDANVTNATPVSTYGNQSGANDPEWVTNSRTVLFGGYGKWASLDDIGPGDDSQVPWMRDGADKGDGEVSRDGRRLVTTAFYGDNKTLAFWEVRGNVQVESPPAQPALACTLTDRDAQYSDPSWSPDGSGVVFRSKAGLQVLRFDAIVGDDRCDVRPGADQIVSATGSEPDWGPADPATARYQPSSSVGSRPAGATATAGAKPGSQRLIAIAKPRISVTALRHGLAIKLTASRAGKVAASLTYRGKRLASAHTTVKRAGTVRLRLSKVSSRSARRLSGKKVKLAVSLKPKGAKTSSASGSYRVR